MAIHTLREGSITERVVLGTALLTTGALLVYTIFQVASRFFAKAMVSVALPKFDMTPEAARALERTLQARYPLPDPVPAVVSPPIIPAPTDAVQQVQSHSLLSSLTLNGVVVTQEMEVPLAKALHLYQELKTEIGGD